MCGIDYCDEISIVLHDRNHKARKQHKCSECNRLIEAGEIYNVQRTVFDGSASTYKTCQHCQVVKSWLSKECGGYIYQGVYSDIVEHAQEGYGIKVKMLGIGMSRKWKRKDGRMWPIPKLPKITEAKHVAH